MSKINNAFKKVAKVLFPKTLKRCEERKALSEKFKHIYITRKQHFEEEKLASNSFAKNETIEPRFFFFTVVDHANIGDHAIMVAQYEMIRKMFPTAQIVEYDCFTYLKNIEMIKKDISVKDILIINGGGNMGNQYVLEETVRQSVIENFPNNSIFSFPQTIFFCEDESRKDDIKKLIDWYSNHNGYYLDYNLRWTVEDEKDKFKWNYSHHDFLQVIAREEKSYEIMKGLLPNQDILLMPDIVLSLGDLVLPKRENKNGLLCLRADTESKLSFENKELLENAVRKFCSEVVLTDTVHTEEVPHELKHIHTYKILGEFARAKFVVTDRLHGMIFAAITGTPCVAMANYNHKVKETYKWLKDLPYIAFCEDITNIETCIEKVLSCKYPVYPIKQMRAKFEPLKKLLRLTYKTNRRI